MNLLLIELYGDGKSLRVCEDKAGIDQLIAEFTASDSDEHFDEFMERRGVQLFLTRRVSLQPSSSLFDSNNP